MHSVPIDLLTRFTRGERSCLIQVNHLSLSSVDAAKYTIWTRGPGSHHFLVDDRAIDHVRLEDHPLHSAILRHPYLLPRGTRAI